MRRMNRVGVMLAWIVAVACGASPALAQGAVLPDPPGNPADHVVVEAKIGQKLDDYLSRLEAFGFNGAVLYAKKDRVFLRKGYGYASIAEDRRNTTTTLFDLASVSKQFTCAAILKLQMEGKLSTDDPVTKFFPELGEDKSGICLFHLMTHTSGIPQAVGEGPETKDRDELIELIRRAPTVSDPGEEFAYNNVGYCLLGAVIEVASGQKYETYMQEHIFAPAGLKNVRFLGDRVPEGIQSAMAHTDDWEMWPAEEGWFSWGWRACAGILANLEDLQRWNDALDDERVLSRVAKLELFNRFLPNYGYGWFVRVDEEKRLVYYHSGNTRGFQAHFERCPETGALLIVLINDSGKYGPVTSGLQGLIAGHNVSMPPAPFDLPPDRLAKLAGEYQTDRGTTFRLTVEDGALVAHNYGLAAVAERLAGREEADLLRTPRYDRRAKEAMDAWQDDDVSPLEGILRERRGWAQELVGEWTILGQAGGGLKQVDILGSVPKSVPDVYTFVGLVCRKRTDVIKLTWRDGEVVSTDRTYPGMMRFVPTGTNDFLSFEITDELTPRDRAMKFVLDEEGNPKHVAILIDFVRLFAKPKR